jgi:hypothetical protein
MCDPMVYKLLYDKKIAFLMAWHPRLGKDSTVRKYINKDIGRMICEEYLTLENQISFKGFDKKPIVYKNVDKNELAIVMIRNSNKFGNISRIDRGLKAQGTLYFQTPYLVTTSQFSYNINGIYKVCEEFGPNYHESKFLNNLHKYTRETIYNCGLDSYRDKRREYQFSISNIGINCLYSDDSCASLGLNIKYNRISDGNLKIYDKNDKNDKNQMLDLKHETKEMLKHVILDKLPENTVVKAIIGFNNMAMNRSSYKEFSISPTVHQIKIYGNCPGLFEDFAFTDEHKYQLFSERINYKELRRELIPHSKGKKLNDLIDLKILKEVKSSNVLRSPKVPNIYIQTPLMRIKWDISYKGRYRDSGNNYVNFGFERLEDMKTERIKFNEDLQFHNDLSLFNKEFQDIFGNVYPVIKTSYKNTDFESQTIRVSETLYENQPQYKLFACYDSNRKEYSFKEALVYLKAGCPARAIYHYCMNNIQNMKDNRGNQVTYIPVKLDQIQFFNENHVNLEEYAFSDSE